MNIGNNLLFPYLKYCNKNGYGNQPGKDFGILKNKLGLDKTKVFHSFRKTLITCLEDNNCSPDNRRMFVGHEVEGKGYKSSKEDPHLTVYSLGKFNPKTIEKLVFPHLDYDKYIGFKISLPEYKTKQFNRYILSACQLNK
jgi:hypothetical protein